MDKAGEICFNVQLRKGFERSSGVSTTFQFERAAIREAQAVRRAVVGIVIGGD
jgi:hypothetical protein